MKLCFIMLIILLVGGKVNAQEKKTIPEVNKPEGIGLRSNSRQHAMVKRDNDHQRRDVRIQQMKRKVQSSKQLKKAKKEQKTNLRNQQKARNKKITLQKKAQLKKLRQQQRMKAKRRNR